MHNKEQNACHEAAHAVIGCLLGKTPIKVSVIGHISPEPSNTEFSPGSEVSPQNRIIIALAGHAADEFLFGIDPPETSSDINEVEKLLKEIGESDYRPYLKKAKKLVEDNFETIQALGDELFKKEVIEGDELLQLLRDLT